METRKIQRHKDIKIERHKEKADKLIREDWTIGFPSQSSEEVTLTKAILSE